MFQKFKALLWKDISYRVKVSTFIPLILIIIFGFLANLETKSILSCCEIKSFHLPAQRSYPFFKSTQKCASNPFDSLGSKILAYEPPSPFLRKLMEDVACLVGFDRANIREGFDKNFDFGIRFNNLQENQIHPPNSLDYVLYPTNDYKVSLSNAPLRFDSPHSHNISPINKMKMAIERVFLRQNEVNPEQPVVVGTDQSDNDTDIYGPDDEYGNLSTDEPDFDGKPDFYGKPDFFNKNYCPQGLYRVHYRVLLPIIMFILESDRFLSCIINEKNSGILEFLKVMGMKICLVRLSAFFVSIIVHHFPIFIALIFIYVPISYVSVIYFTVDAGTMFFYLFICSFYISAFIYMGSFFFRNGLLASLVNACLWFSSIIFFIFIELGSSVSKATLTGVAFIPHYWCVQGFTLLSKFERLGKKAALSENQSPGENYIPVGNYFLIGIFGTIMYILIGAYLENILPGKYGRSLPVYYIFIKSFWTGKKVEEYTEVEESEEVKPNREMFDEKPRNLTVGISIQNLTKVYSLWKKKSSKKALDNVTFDIYEGEILGLLGHNGAGKTTLISIICGMIPKTSGKVIVNGVDIEYSNAESEVIGYCPQFDILLNGLSVYKNLIFFGLAKNLSLSQAKEEANDLLLSVGLVKSKKVRAINLSGGQRRKLCLGIALIGPSPVLILDEPTTGIDIPSRRDIWELLLKLRGKKTVILSTHFMEEADALCDRIVVIADGQVKSHGTPMFLKSKLGSGYTLSVVVPNNDKIEGTTDLVLKKIKGSTLKRQNLLTVSYQLPEKEFSTFPGLFESLESKKKNGEIVSYSATVSTMDDVFLNLDEALKKDDAAKKGRVQQELTIDQGDEEQPRKRNLTGVLLFLNQLGALLIKKFIFLRRDIILFLCLAVITLALDAIFDRIVKQQSRTESSSSRTKSSSSEIKFFSESPDGSCSYFDSASSGPQGFDKIISSYEPFLRNPSFNVTVNYKYLKSNGSQKIKRQDPEFKEIFITPMLYAFRFSIFFLVFILLGIVQEYESHLKTFQLMLVSPIIYWLAHILFDYILLIIHLILSIIILGSSDKSMKDFILQNLGHVASGYLYHTFCMLLITYIVAKTCKRFIIALLILVIFFFLGIIFALPLPEVQWLRNFFPTTLLIDHFSKKLWQAERCERLSSKSEFPMYESPLKKICLHLDTIWIAMTIHVLLLPLLLILLDNGIITYLFHQMMSLVCCIDFNKSKRSDNVTVENEREKVRDLKKRNQLSSKVLVVDDVRRWYCSCRGCKGECTTVAVNGVSFCVAERECFALLGVNGAGKTTIFKILTGMIEPTRGNAYVKSSSVLNFCCRFRIFAKMGYCSQFANYLPNFKGREMIELFGRLRGMRGSQLRNEVNRLVQMSQLQEYERKKCKSYSGGTLRKLSVLMAMIGEPLVILLDEPTTGIDPAARRSIWDLVIKYRDDGHAVLLTSHSMEECEALSSRVGIMIKGVLRCVGEPTTLKSLFGETYFVSLKLSIKATDEDRSKIKKAITDTFGSKCQLTDEHLSIMQYQIPMESANWEKLFSELNSLKSKNPFLEHFSASSTTLEQVFLHFTKTYQQNIRHSS